MRFFLFLLHWLSGYCRLRCGCTEAVAVLNFLMKRDIPYRNLCRADDGSIEFYMLRKNKRLFMREAGGSFASLCIEREYGLPHLLYLYRKRSGLLVGAVLFSVITFLSGQFIWDMDLKGNERISNVQIYDTLRSLGCGIGSYIPGLNLYSVCGRYLIADPEIAWISVNLEGTVAHVEVIEKEYRSHAEMDLPDDTHPSNLVAARDGMIVSWELGGGEVVVHAGQVVRKGDLLVSGIVENRKSDTGQFRLERSAGRVLAQTARIVTVSVPLVSEKTVCRDAYIAEKAVIFFGKEIKLLKNSRNLPPQYDIIKNTDRMTLFSGIGWLQTVRLPLYRVTKTVCVQERERVTLSCEDAGREAERQFWILFGKETDGMELESYTVERGMNQQGTAFEITCTVYGIENIAEERTIALTESETPESSR